MTEPEFTSDWFTRRIPMWKAALAGHAGQPIDYLEIGSFEGRSALYIAESFPGAKLTCIDLWEDAAREARFDRNLAPHLGRLTKMKGRSTIRLDELGVAGAKFDVIYIDGAHDGPTTFTDSAQAWPLLRVGGIMIWDDYGLWHRKKPIDRPDPAINAFLLAFDTCLKQIERGGQVIVRKTAEWPNAAPPFVIGTQIKRLQRHIRTRKF